MFGRIFSVVAVAAAMSLSALTGTAGAAAADVPEDARVAAVEDGSTGAEQISKEEYLRRAANAGISLSPAETNGIKASAVNCWAWDAWKNAKNRNGDLLWTSHHRPNWCGDGQWIRVHAFTERWGETHFLGWTDKGLTQQGEMYGVNWSEYKSWSQRKFCLFDYLGCVEESNPYHNTSVFPNGGTRWN